MARELSARGKDRLATAPIAWLAVNRAEAPPHVTPVWFTFDSGTFWISTAARNVKVRLLRADHRVAIAIDGTADDPIVAEASVVLRQPEEGLEAVRQALAAKYDGWDAFDPSPDGDRVVLQAAVTRWLLIS